jgi:GntR family transcriptional regulator / MocR family aminotransferase
MRVRYRARRHALLTGLETELPEAVTRGIDAGLHAAVELPDGDSEERIRTEAAGRGVALERVADRCIAARRPPTLLLGYARSTEARIAAGVRELATAVRASRGRER